MNLFRSEEHARSWDGFNPAMAASLMPVARWAEIFSNPFFQERGRTDYISWAQSDDGKAAFIQLRGDLPTRYRERLGRLNSWMTDLDRGDTMTFTHVPDAGLTVVVSGETRGVLSGEDFAGGEPA